MDFLSLVAYLKMDKSDYEKGLKDSESLAKKAGRGIGSVLGTTAKVAAAGIATTTTAVAGLVTASVNAYSEFEQLEGGVQTLFKNSADTVMKYAEDAYKTAGLSANEYMETVTSFSASLLQSLGGDTEAAAKKADRAIQDMSDNANKMGSSMESIQNAYQGFAKQNYTMLDNLKLGYGGTQEEMKRLIQDASKLTDIQRELGVTIDADSMSYANVVDAISVIQKSMGIMGTTAQEAEKTISGSIRMLGSSWKDLVTGLTNPNADIGKLIDKVVYSAKAALNNLLPAISQALTGVVSLVRDMVPVITKELPSLIRQTLPLLIKAGVDLFDGLIDALPAMMEVLFDQLPTVMRGLIRVLVKLIPMIVELGFTFLEALVKGLLDALPMVMTQLTQLVLGLVNMLTDPKNLDTLIKGAVDIVLALADGIVKALPVLIPAIVDVILTIVEKLTEPDMIILLIEAAVDIMVAIAKGLVNSIPRVIYAITTLIGNILQALAGAIPVVLEGALELFGSLLKGLLITIPNVLMQVPIFIVELLSALAKGIKSLWDMGVKFVKAIGDGIKSLNPAQWGRDLMQNFINGLLAKWDSLKRTVNNIAGSIRDFLGFSEPKLGPLSDFHTFAPDMMELFAKGITDNKKMLLDTVSDAFDFEDTIVGPGTSSSGSTRSGNGGDLRSLLEAILNLLPQLANQQIVLDTGALVGQTAPQMNKALGTIYSREQRGV